MVGFLHQAVLSQESQADEIKLAEDNKRALYFFSKFNCKCEKEEWTRTLAGCWEPCVEPQRALVRQLVAQRPHLSDDQIRERMIADAGSDKVIHIPSTFPKLIPYGILAVLGFGLLLVLRGMRKGSLPANNKEDASHGEDHAADGDLDARIEEELNKLKD